ncbi:MAG: Lpg1974 family pore-forming outer membrane protein [Simkaniaceae bacterium]
MRNLLPLVMMRVKIGLPFLLFTSMLSSSEKGNIFCYRPPLNEPAFFVSGEFLYWKAVENNLDYVIKGQPVPPAGTETSAIGTEYSAKFGGDPGMRFELGYRFCPQFWDVSAQYLYYKGNGHANVHHPAFSTSQMIVGTFAQNTNAEMEKASSSIKLTCHLLDFILAKRFELTENLLFKFNTGVTALWMDQDWRVNYDPFFINNQAQSNLIQNNWNFSGAGIRFGFEQEWYFGSGFGFLTEFSTAGIVGDYETKRLYKATPLNGASQTLSDASFHDTRFVPNIQFLLGPNWGRNTCYGHINLFAGYEIQAFFNLAELNRSSFNTNSGSRVSHLSQGVIALQGLTVKLLLNF